MPRSQILTTLVPLLILTGCGWGDFLARSNAKFTFDQGSEYCRHVQLPRSTPEAGHEDEKFFHDGFMYHVDPTRPGVLLATNRGMTGEHHSTTTLVVDFKSKVVTAEPATPAKWPTWRQVTGKGRQSDGPNGNFTYWLRALENEKLHDNIRTWGPSGRTLGTAVFSPGKKFVEVWSANEKPRPAPDGTGTSFMEIFRVSDGKRLVKAHFDRQRVPFLGVECCSAISSDSEYFLVVADDGPSNGLVCYFPPAVLP